MRETQLRQSRQAPAGAGRERRNPKMLIFTLVDEVAVTMDACGTNTRTVDNHHSHDSDQRNTERLTGRGRS
jgi:hypothetical protein